MDSGEVDRLVQQLSTGFQVLQDEYQKLHGQHQLLERKLATAREQYNELAKLCGRTETSTPPLSLSSSPGRAKDPQLAPRTTAEILERSNDGRSKQAANKIRTATVAANGLQHAVPATTDGGAVKIWSGPAADQPEKAGSSSLMPSIAESPLEQDFTVDGKPSELGCPFASMTRKRLSSHAASVLSRYNPTGSVGTTSTPDSNANRVNGRESFSRRRSRRESMLDPIKAEICGLSDHATTSPQAERAVSKGPTEERQIESGETGVVCPIRFLDQHSPEEVATYFEKHKHELPRSHEVCVMRYQSNEEQIKQLDAKYGNLVSMIQGLGEKHKEMLPEEPESAEDDALHHDAASDEKIRKWASSVNAQAPAEDESEARLPHFERPVRDIRVGESPSRPWGIHVPATYEPVPEHDGERSPPAPMRSPAPGPAAAAPPPTTPHAIPVPRARAPGKCPFDHAALPKPVASQPRDPAVDAGEKPAADAAAAPPVADIPAAPVPEAIPRMADALKVALPASIVIHGPVFIGYSPEDAIRILKESGLNLNR